MRGLLVLHKRDWLSPKAGAFEFLLHELLRRAAARGNYVAWVAKRAGLNPFGTRMRPTEIRDGIQILRLGVGPLHRVALKTFLARLAQNPGMYQRLDVVLNCVWGKPLQIQEWTDLPELPLVVQLHRGIRISQEAAGPVIAVGPEAGRALLAAGLPDKRLVQVPFIANQPAKGQYDYEKTVELLLGAIKETCAKE